MNREDTFFVVILTVSSFFFSVFSLNIHSTVIYTALNIHSIVSSGNIDL